MCLKKQVSGRFLIVIRDKFNCRKNQIATGAAGEECLKNGKTVGNPAINSRILPAVSILGFGVVRA
jgi:hypothetical protein